MAVLGTLRTAPWWRGPALLVRRPGVAVALFAAAAVATLPAAAAVPFLSSARNATLHHQLVAACPGTVGLLVTGRTLVPPSDPARYGDPAAWPDPSVADAMQRRALARITATVPELGPPVRTLHLVLTGPGAAGAGDGAKLRLMARPDFAAHVSVLAGPDGEGVWLPDGYAARAHLGVGQRITLALSPVSPPQPVRVAAIYRDLRSEPARTWWCGVAGLYDPPDADYSNNATPELVLTDPAGLLRLADTVGSPDTLDEYPLADPALSTDRLAALVPAIARARAAILADPAFAPITSAGLATLGITGTVVGGRPTTDTQVPVFARRSTLAYTAMRGTVTPITAAGVGIGLLVVAAATVFWVQRRRRELAVLAAHGAGTGALGVKAAIEALPALLLGTVAGWAAAWLLVRGIGPDPVLSAAARPRAVQAAVAALLAMLVVVAVVAALSCRGLADQVQSRRHRLLRVLPWEVLALAGAGVLWQRLGGAHEVDGAAGGAVAQVPVRLLAVPIVVAVGLIALAGRILAWWLRRFAARRGHRRPGAYLGWRRLSRQAVATVVLGAATALPVALALFGATVTGSVRQTISDEARLRLGSDVVVTLSRDAPVPATLAGRATVVYRLDTAQVGGHATDLLVVDPATFAAGAYWNGDLDGESMPALLSRLTSGSDSGAAVLASAPVEGGDQELALPNGQPLAGGWARVHAVAWLPAEQGGYPVALTTRTIAGTAALRDGVPQLWIRGDPARIRAVLAGSDLPVARVRVAADSYRGTIWEPLTYTFDYLTALSLLTGVVATVGLLLYLESRAPGHRRAYVLLRRMGLRPGAHRGAVLRELAVPLLAGLAAGLALVVGLTLAVRPEIEVNPGIPPDTVLRWPVLPAVLIAAVITATMLGAAGYAQRRISRASPAEVLRDTA